MTRLIDADELTELVNWTFARPPFSRKTMKHMIDMARTVDAEPVRHGRWKWLSCTYDRVPKEKEYECSECHHKTLVHGDDAPWEYYCPNCGAKMDAERRDEHE